MLVALLLKSHAASEKRAIAFLAYEAPCFLFLEPQLTHSLEIVKPKHLQLFLVALAAHLDCLGGDGLIGLPQTTSQTVDGCSLNQGLKIHL